jgi:hypothetical protein
MRRPYRLFPYFVLVCRRLSTILLWCTFATALTILDIAFAYLRRRYGGKRYGGNCTRLSSTVSVDEPVSTLYSEKSMSSCAHWYNAVQAPLQDRYYTVAEMTRAREKGKRFQSRKVLHGGIYYTSALEAPGE